MKLLRAAAVFLLLHCLASCAVQGSAAPAPTAVPRPAVLDTLPEAENGLPLLSVYIVQDNALREMDIETYLCGVLAGEMPHDWPLEALKAQAILARTFVLKFVSEKTSRYDGADISTDITEAQAYDEASINDAIRQAVAETRGQVLVASSGVLPYAWFHAHSGGSTALAREGLGWQDAEPAYTRVEKGLDSPDAPETAAVWEARFPARAFLAACRSIGADVSSCNRVSIVQKGPSGRAVTLAVEDAQVSAAELRLALGSTVMRSTLLTELRSENGTVFMAGRGYGHGVGMPQWGAYALAQDGMTAEDIATYYYENVSIAAFW